MALMHVFVGPNGEELASRGGVSPVEHIEQLIREQREVLPGPTSCPTMDRAVIPPRTVLPGEHCRQSL